MATKHILVVEDEEDLAASTKEFLRRWGFETTHSKNTEEAISVFTEHPMEFCLAIIDLSVPKQGGKWLIQRMLKINPGTRIIISSGGDSSDIESEFPGITVLTKPYPASKLKEAIG